MIRFRVRVYEQATYFMNRWKSKEKGCLPLNYKYSIYTCIYKYRNKYTHAHVRVLRLHNYACSYIILYIYVYFFVAFVIII